MTLEAANATTPALGVRLASTRGEAVLAAVHDGSPARAAGLSAGDTLVALDGLRVTADSLEARLARCAVGDVRIIHAFRRDELMSFAVTLAAGDAPTTLSLNDKPSAVMRRLRTGWLGS